MADSLADLLHAWHDFYILAGTAAATLVGLMFVAASIGSSVFGKEHVAPMRAFLTPTVVHFAAIVLVCLLLLVPTASWRLEGTLIGAAGLAGSLYGTRNLVQLIVRQRFNVNLLDRFFYALIPLVGYLLVLAAGAMLFAGVRDCLGVLAVAVLTLLVAAVRNAWDMTVWVMIRTPSAAETAAKPTESSGTPPERTG